MGWVILASVLAPTLSLVAWLLVRVVNQNDAAHVSMQNDIGELKIGQARIEEKVDMLLEDRKHASE